MPRWRSSPDARHAAKPRPGSCCARASESMGTPGCPRRRSTRTGGCASCSAATGNARCEPVPTPAGARAASCALPGARPRLAVVPVAAWARARAWPTTWGWARRSRLLAALLAERQSAGPDVAGRRCWSARCRSSATGSARPRASRPSCRCMVHHGRERARTGAAFTRAARASDARAHQLRARCTATASCSAAVDVGAASSSTRRRTSRTRTTKQAQAVARAARRPPRRADRHAGREPRSATCGRSWTSSTPGCSARAREFQRALRRADRARPRRRGAPSGCSALTGAVHPAPAEDRQDDHRRPAREDRDEGRLHAHPRAGDALPGGGRRDARRRPDGAEGIERQGHRAGDAHEAQAGLQPPGALPAATARALAGPLGQADARSTEMLDEVAGRRATRRSCFTQFAEMGDAPAAPPAGDVRPRGAVPARRHAARQRATRWSRGSRAPDGPAACSCSR